MTRVYNGNCISYAC